MKTLTKTPIELCDSSCSLLGFGVVLAWLLLFHLLVNIWLLCVFTSLLVVLGGWLGSQAVLESNNVVHLERFITLEQVPSSMEDEDHLDEEIHNTVRKIIQDFVTSWYSTVSSESGFETEVQEAMISMAMELKMRARQVDRKELTQRILDLFGCHLQDYISAKELVAEQETLITAKRGSDSERLWKAYSSVTAPHLAMTSDKVELNYTRAVVDLLLHVLVPPPHLESRTGRFVVEELITCNVLLPLIAKLSDPDWLNLLMIEIFDKSGKPHKQIATEPLTSSLPLSSSPPVESELTPLQETSQIPQKNIEVAPAGALTEMVHETEMSVFSAYDVVDSKQVNGPPSNAEEEETEPFLKHYIRGSKSNPFYQENDSDLDSPLADYKRSSIDSLVMIDQGEGLEDRHKDCTTCAENNNGLDLEVVFKTAEMTLSMSNHEDLEKSGSSTSVNPTKDLPLHVEQTGLGNPNELTVVSPLQGSSPMPSFSFEPLSSPDGPVIIQNLRITGTITAKEHRGTGSHPYTLYTIKYETAIVTQTSWENPSPVAYHTVNRRYSEFLNLQTRLEEKTDLRKLIKGVKGPKKIFPDMPFGNMDSDKIEARKGLLETFLKQLCAIPEIANSEEMQEFLALNTDARIAFVKKPFIVSRIDKIVVNAIVDTLKTAFPRSEPQSPTEDNEAEVDGGKISVDKKSKSRLKFSSKNIPFMNGSDVKPQNVSSLVCHSESCFMCVLHVVNAASETDLAEVALNILCLLMREQWSWLCTENIQRTIRLLFGTLINRWLDVSVANLTCTRYWVVYLQVIQEAIWPGGALRTAPQLERSQQQKDSTRQQALHCLMKLLPDLVSDMLGSDKYKRSWQTALDSLQDPYINRHLVYCIFDLLLEFMVPEIPEVDFQKSLLQTLSKNPEKWLA
uniref:Sorting nexin 19b n=1 Tax=Anabas testudineus TaxID=64144 RepID=A0A7N6FLF5_ANATE